jgi:WD40 repeat protein/serine/threonine protein kinase
MTPERWQRIKQLYHTALEREANEREAFLAEACAGDEAFRIEIKSLLRCDARAEGFMEAPALEVAAQLQAEEQAAETFDPLSHTNLDPSKPGSGSSPVPPIFIGDYRVLRKLGEGGMGVVYEAEQRHPRRLVALKVIRGGRLVDEYQVKLFQREVQALARLKHQGIAAIYEAGRTDDGQHYFVMELAPGVPLLDYVKGRRLTGAQAPSNIRQRLELFLKICEAISYAHQRGVIHRDLKPANILVAGGSDKSGGQSLDGPGVSRVEVKVLDFGLARITDEDGAGASGLSQAGQVRGTLPYMSPEQVRGDPDRIDVRTDVYALGVILYELLTERLPYDLEQVTLPQAIRIICEEAPKPVNRALGESRDRESRKTERIDRDIETIAFKALEKEPERRYRSAAAMAEDVTRYLTNQPIQARPPSAFYQFRKLVARNKVPFASLVAVFALLLGFAITMAALSARIARERDKVVQQELSNRRLLYAAHMNLAMQAWEMNDIGRVEELVDSHIPKPGEEDMRGFEWYYLWRLCHRDLLTLKGHIHNVTWVAFSPDGNRLASGSIDRTVKLWDAVAGQELLTLRGHGDRVLSVSFSPDSLRLASGSVDRTVKLWDVVTGKELLTIKGHGDAVSSVTFSPDGERLVSGSADRTVKVWDAVTGQELLTIKGHGDAVSSVTFSPDSKRVATGSIDRTVKLWDSVTGRELLTLRGHGDTVSSVTFSPDGKRLATGSLDHTVKMWDAANGQELLTLKGHGDEVRSLAYSPDGKRLASGSIDRTVKLWDAGTGRELLTLEGHGDVVRSVAFSPDGKRLATGGRDRTVKLWDAVAIQGPLTLEGHGDFVRSVAFSPDGKKLASGSFDRTVKLWDASTGQELLTLKGHGDLVYNVTFSPDGKTLASGSADRTVRLWDSNTGQELLTLEGHGYAVSSVTFPHDGKRNASGMNSKTAAVRAVTVTYSPDGKRLATGSYDHKVRLWDSNTGQELLILKGHGDHVSSVAFSPDGKRLATGSWDHIVKVWDSNTGQELLTLKGHGDQIVSVAFSPDGKRLATGSVDRTVKLWDAGTGQELLTLKGHAGIVLSVAFSPDGKRLATGSADRTFKLWDAVTGQELLTLKGHPDYVRSVAFSPDGKTLASGSNDRTVKLWRAATEQEVVARSKQ